MTDLYGTQGTKRTGLGFANIAKGLNNAPVKVYIRDEYEAAAAVAQNDRVSLGTVPSWARLDAVLSRVDFDAFGAGVTGDVGIDDTKWADYVETSNLLVDGADISAAGSVSLLKNVDLPKRNKMLWEVLGLSSDPGALLELWFSFKDANPAAGSLAWVIGGTD